MKITFIFLFDREQWERCFELRRFVTLVCQMAFVEDIIEQLLLLLLLPCLLLLLYALLFSAMIQSSGSFGE